MCSLLYDFSMVQNQNAVRIHDGAQPMCNYKAGASLHQFIHRFLDQHLRPGIHIGGCFVQNQQRAVHQQCPGNGQQLALPTGQIYGILTDRRVIPLWHGADKMVTPCSAANLFNSFPRCIRYTVGYIFRNGSPKKPGILQNHAELLPYMIPG